MGRLSAVMASALLLASLGRALATGDDGVALDYDVRFGPLRLLTMSFATEATGERYRASLVLETQGLIGRLFPWRAESETQGRRDGDLLRPERHRAEGTYRAIRRSVEIDYAPDGSVRSRIVPPPEQDGRDAVPDALQQATIDPITASLQAVAAACRGTLAVFDGRRRYDMHLAELPSGEVPSRQGVYHGPARRCRATIEPHAGFWRSAPHESETPARLEFWIASPAPGLPPAPVYLELSGARGTLAVVLRRARALRAPPA
jgi:hypothetical protein